MQTRRSPSLLSLIPFDTSAPGNKSHAGRPAGTAEAPQLPDTMAATAEASSVVPIVLQKHSGGLPGERGQNKDFRPDQIGGSDTPGTTRSELRFYQSSNLSDVGATFATKCQNQKRA